MKLSVRHLIFDNFSYKIVSLFIALILWMTILGRRDYTITRNFELDFVVSNQSVMLKQSADKVKIKATGPRTAIRRFMETEASQVITIDLSKYEAGIYEVEIPTSKVDVPFGVKVMGLQPSKVQVQIGKKD